MALRLSVVAVGDELLRGDIADTNTPCIRRSARAWGAEVVQATAVGDSTARIADAVRLGLDGGADVVIVTGGLGPTRDDVTKSALCSLTSGTLRRHPDVLAHVERMMAERMRPMNDLTATQADLPDTCTPITNSCGTAPGMWFDLPGDRVVVCMPGVPFEMEAMLAGQVWPRLASRFGLSHTPPLAEMVVWGLSESAIAGMLDGADTGVGYYPGAGYVRLRLLPEAPLDEVRRRLDGYILYEGAATPAEALLDEMRRRRLTLATAESCTGGNIAHRLTLVPGSSDVFAGAVVSYSNRAKVAMLGVDPDAISSFGAVSGPVVQQMATGALRRLDADIALATSGIAGPGGAVPGKPVGTVWSCVALLLGGRCVAEPVLSHFPGPRSQVIERATTHAICSALRALQQHPEFTKA